VEIPGNPAPRAFVSRRMFDLSLPDLSELWPKLLATVPALLLVVVGAYAAQFFLCRALRAVARHSHLTDSDVAPLRRIARWAILVVALLAALNIVGFNLGGLWGVMSTLFAMIAVGFVAVWSMLSNTLCTLLILISRPFAVGDDIEFVGEPTKGRVTDLNFLFTTLLAEDGGEIRVPNNLFFQKILKRRRSTESGARSLADQLKRPQAA